MKITFIGIIFSFLIQSLICPFDLSLFKEINSEGEFNNLIISPLSIFQILSLISNGSKGKTQLEILTALEEKNITKLSEINIDIISIFQKFKSIEIKNEIITKFTPVKSFMDISSQYLAKIEIIENEEKIKQQCDKFKKNETLIILYNSIHFKGIWSNKYKFDSKLTTKKIFYNYGTNIVYVDTMIQENKFLFS